MSSTETMVKENTSSCKICFEIYKGLRFRGISALFPWLSIGLIISKKSLARYSKLNFPFISASPKFPFAETSLPFPLLRELKERLPILIAVSGLEICKLDTFISPSKFLKSFPEKLAFSTAEKSVAEYPFDKFKACGANFFIAASI